MVVDPESRPRIAKVWANNFRSIESAELELGPLTVLVGPNASGKSNLMDILWFLGDSARLGLESGHNSARRNRLNWPQVSNWKGVGPGNWLPVRIPMGNA